MQPVLNPFFPFHSDRSRVSIPAVAYRSSLESYRALFTLDAIAALHDDERAQLGSSPWGWYERHYGGSCRRLRNSEVLRIRRAYGRLIQQNEVLDFDDTARLLAVTNLLVEHVRKGEGTFRRPLPYSSDDIISALGIDPFLIRKTRQVMVDDVFSWIDHAFSLLQEYSVSSQETALDHFSLSADSGQSLLGVHVFQEYGLLKKRDVVDVLRGLVLLGYADDYTTRRETMAASPHCVDGKTPFRIGGGKDLPLDTQLRHAHLGGRHITLRNLEDCIARGIVVEDPRTRDHPEIKNAYVRLDPREGLSDLAALIFLKLRHGDACMLGGMLSDGLDSYKSLLYDPFYGSLPFYVANYIERNYQRLFGVELVSSSEKHQVVYYGAKLNTDRFLVSPSHRNLNRGLPSLVRALLHGSSEHDFAFFRTYSPQGIRSDYPLSVAIDIVSRRHGGYAAGRSAGR